jgi:hypothetical protein
MKHYEEHGQFVSWNTGYYAIFSGLLYASKAEMLLAEQEKLQRLDTCVL